MPGVREGGRMRPRQCRAVMKWVGAVLCVMLLVAMLASEWRALWLLGSTLNSHWSVMVSNGAFAVLSLELPRSSGPSAWEFVFRPLSSRALMWKPALWAYPAGATAAAGWTMVLPLYIPFILLVIPTAWLFFRDRRSVREGGRGPRDLHPCGVRGSGGDFPGVPLRGDPRLLASRPSA